MLQVVCPSALLQFFDETVPALWFSGCHRCAGSVAIKDLQEHAVIARTHNIDVKIAFKYRHWRGSTSQHAIAPHDTSSSGSPGACTEKLTTNVVL
jgi:hypothetical protein